MADINDKVWSSVNTSADLGEFLRRLREERGWSQQKLAEELGTTRQYVRQIEAGKPGLFTERLFQALRLLDANLRVENTLR